LLSSVCFSAAVLSLSAILPFLRPKNKPEAKFFLFHKVYPPNKKAPIGAILRGSRRQLQFDRNRLAILYFLPEE